MEYFLAPLTPPFRCSFIEIARSLAILALASEIFRPEVLALIAEQHDDSKLTVAAMYDAPVELGTHVIRRKTGGNPITSQEKSGKV